MSAGEDLNAEDWPVEALLAFDAALASGRAPREALVPGSPLAAVHECQRLLEVIWPRATPVHILPDDRFGRFLIRSELGRGGFGVVYLAEDTLLGRKVALKLPRPEVLVTPEVRRRFVREGEAASRLDHPNIVPIYDVGEVGSICFIASAYCPGLTLAEWLRGQIDLVPARTAAELVAKLAGAVGHAHERRILHRDLKPGNVLLRCPEGGEPGLRDGPEVHPRICDFGLAKFLDEEPRNTCSGVPLGSPAYMAPEQAAGRHREVGPAADVHALGAILYELLTGRPPFRGETVLETLHEVALREPTPLRSLRPGLPRDLETICMKCLEKRPERRYADGSRLADDLGRFLAGKPVQARPVSAWVHAGKWVRRRPVHAALAACLALALLGSAGGLAWSAARDRRHNAELLEALDRSQRNWASGQIRLAQFYYDAGKVEIASEILDQMPPEPRGFALDYLNRICKDQLPCSVKLPLGACASALSPDDRTVALGDRKGDLRLWDRMTGAVRALKGGHNVPVQIMAFSPDGRTLVSSAADKTRFWDVASGEEWPNVPPDGHRSDGFVFGPDGRTLTAITVGSDPDQFRARLWHLSPRERRVTPAAILTRNQIPIDLSADDASRGIAWSADGIAVALGEGDGGVRIFENRECANPVAICRILGKEVFFVPRSLGSDPLSPAEIDRIGLLARRMTGRERERPLCRGLAVRTARFSPDGRTLAYEVKNADGYSHEVSIIETATGRTRASYALGEVATDRDLLFAEGGRSLVITGAAESPKAQLWRFEGRPEPPSPRGHVREGKIGSPPDGSSPEVWGLAFSPDGRTLASSGDDHTIKLWDAAAGHLIRTLSAHESLVTCVAFSPDGRWLASGSFDKRKPVGLWNASTGEPLGFPEGHTDRVRTLSFSPDGKTLATGGDDHTVRLWDVASRRPRCAPLVGHTSTLYGVAFSPDGRLLASGAEREIRLWDAATGQPRGVLRSEGFVMALAFSPDGRILAAPTLEGSITLWDTPDWKPRPPLHGHSLEVMAVAFSPDGRTLASGGRDKTVRLWDPAAGQELLTLKGHEHRIHGMAFSPDGRTLASGAFDGAIKLWRSASPGTERAFEE